MTYVAEGFLGSGDLHIDVLNPTTLVSTGELDVGNAINFSIKAPTLTKKELTGMRRENYAETIESVITKMEQELSFTLTDINRKNLALAMFGTDAAFTQSAANNTGTPETVTAYLDKWVKLAARQLDPDNAPVVTDTTATTTYVEDTDYEVDYQVGRIKALSTGSITDGQSLKVGSTWLAITGGYTVTANSVNKFYAYIRMVGLDQTHDRDCEVIVFKAQIEPSGDISWLTEDFAQLEFNGKILSTDNGTWEARFYTDATAE